MEIVLQIKQLRKQFIDEMKSIDESMDGIIISKLKAGILSVDMMKALRKVSFQFDESFEINLKEFDFIFKLLRIEEYDERHLVSLFKHFTRKYPVYTLKLMYDRHPSKKELEFLTSSLSKVGKGNDTFILEDFSKDIQRYLTDKWIFTVPKTDTGKDEILFASRGFLKNEKFKPIEFLDLTRMIAIHIKG
jgi:hypothetical protein